MLSLPFVKEKTRHSKANHSIEEVVSISYLMSYSHTFSSTHYLWTPRPTRRATSPEINQGKMASFL